MSAFTIQGPQILYLSFRTYVRNLIFNPFPFFLLPYKNATRYRHSRTRIIGYLDFSGFPLTQWGMTPFLSCPSVVIEHPENGNATDTLKHRYSYLGIHKIFVI